MWCSLRLSNPVTDYGLTGTELPRVVQGNEPLRPVMSWKLGCRLFGFDRDRDLSEVSFPVNLPAVEVIDGALPLRASGREAPKLHSREPDEEVIETWAAEQWPVMKGRRPTWAPGCAGKTRPGRTRGRSRPPFRPAGRRWPSPSCPGLVGFPTAPPEKQHRAGAHRDARPEVAIFRCSMAFGPVLNIRSRTLTRWSNGGWICGYSG